MTNKPRGVLYIGVSNNIERRSFEHQTKQSVRSFAARYNTDRLVYYEETASVEDAISREKQLKNWHRDWKINLVEAVNPGWNNLLELRHDEIPKQVRDDKRGGFNDNEKLKQAQDNKAKEGRG